jgi:predicted O-linked N-acetylglucosamine transferase (SPINDLY family)
MRVLKATEGSVLWLAPSDPAAVENLRREAQKFLVSPERLIFAPRVAANADHLARFRQADLFLDTLPFNGHATTSDALWAGVPVLTCLGPTLAGRVAASQLNAAGLSELVAQSLEGYEALALKLANDPSLTAGFKNKLARDRGRLFHTVRFTRHVEAAYVAMQDRHRRQERPRGFAVEPIN